MSLPQNPHDKFAHNVFTNLDVTRELFDRYLPQPLREILNLETLRLTDGKFINQQYGESRTDMLFEVETVTAELLLILVLFEHKSYLDKKTLLQVLADMVQKWSQELDNGADQLTPIIPIIFYHGEQSWPYPTDLRLLFPSNEVIDPYIPTFNAILQDFSIGRDQPIEGSHRLRSFLNAFRYVRATENIDLQRFIGLLLADLVDWNQEVLNYTVDIVYYLVEVTGKVTYEQLVDVLEHQGDQGDSVMRTLKMEMLDILRPEAKRLAEEEVTRQVTRQVTQQVTQQTFTHSILKVLRTRFGSVDSRIIASINQLEDPDYLDQLLSHALTSDSISEFKKFLP